MTYDELLARIDAIDKALEERNWILDLVTNKALRAVVELHNPMYGTHDKLKEVGICLTCTPRALNIYEAIRYPCPTIQAIEKVLSEHS